MIVIVIVIVLVMVMVTGTGTGTGTGKMMVLLTLRSLRRAHLWSINQSVHLWCLLISGRGNFATCALRYDK